MEKINFVNERTIYENLQPDEDILYICPKDNKSFRFLFMILLLFNLILLFVIPVIIIRPHYFDLTRKISIFALTSLFLPYLIKVSFDYFKKDLVLTNKRILLAFNKKIVSFENSDIEFIEAFKRSNIHTLTIKSYYSKLPSVLFCFDGFSFREEFLKVASLSKPIKNDMAKAVAIIIISLIVFSNFHISKINRHHNTEKITAQYMQLMQNDIKSKWNPPIKNEYTKTVLQYKINKDGTITDIEIIKTSGDEKYDLAAIEALKFVSPLKPLPYHLRRQAPVTMQFVFGMNIDKKDKQH